MSSPANRVAAANAPDARPLRFVTAASLFDGHDAAINIMRRLIQAQGAEVIHLGHNRSVEDVVRAALQEDADAIALSSYQGGHVEYFKYMVDMLKERNASHIRVFGGGGGTITPEEIAELQAYGVERIYHPNDGMHLGLVAMIEDVVRRTSESRAKRNASDVGARLRATDGSGDSGRPQGGLLQEHADLSDEIAIAHQLSAIENGELSDAEMQHLRKQWQLAGGKTPVIGLTGTGGAGKSSVTDELLNRFLASFPEMRIAVVSVDPTRRRTGGALLGDRIRMNSLRSKRVFMRSMATRRQHMATNVVLKDCISFLKSLGYDLVIVDPPSFAPTHRALPTALAAYRELHRLALAAVAPGGLLAAASCSSHVPEAEFLATLLDAAQQTRRRLRILEIHGQPADHPTLPAFPEGRYLKFILCRVD